jgi:NADH-quinone oxidoreductase subunit M
VVLGHLALDPSGIDGAVLQMVSHGLATSGLFLVVGALSERGGTRDMGAFGGLARAAPRLATLAMAIVLSTIGVPPLAGFAAEFLLLRGVFESSPVRAAGGAVGLVLGAVAFLWLYQRVFFGPGGDATGDTRDLDRRETAVLAPLAALLLLVGLYPRIALDYVVRPAHLVAFQVWNDPDAPPRYAPTPEEQDALVRDRLRRRAPEPSGQPEAPRP